MNDVLRGVVIAGIATLLLLRAADDGRREAQTGRGAAALLVCEQVAPPDDRALDSLAAAAARAPLLAALPPAPRLATHAPSRLVAGRAAAIAFDVFGEPGAEQVVVLRDETGAALDSALVQPGSRGVARAAFRVRPAREGWHEWRVEAGGEVRVVGGRAAAAAPVRVLIAAGPANAETRFLTAALEEAGAAVQLRQPLGHGLTAGASPGALPASAAALRDVDVVIVLTGVTLDAARRRALAEFVEQGGGVLVAARDPLLHMFGLAAGTQPPAGSVRADSLDWRLPAELAALPAGTLRGAVEMIAAADDAVPAATLAGAVSDAAGDAVLVLRGVGRGRAAALALRETWRWRIEAGRVDEHREFWRSLVDWLAPASQPFAAIAGGGTVATGIPVTIEVERRAGSLTLRRPDGRVEPVPQRSAADAALARVSFVPVDTGVHELAASDDRAITAVRAAPSTVRAAPSTVHESAARLALLAAASGGRAVPRDVLADTIAARGGPGGRRTEAWRSAAFALLLALTLADWSLRRLRGRT